MYVAKFKAEKTEPKVLLFMTNVKDTKSLKFEGKPKNSIKFNVSSSLRLNVET